MAEAARLLKVPCMLQLYDRLIAVATHDTEIGKTSRPPVSSLSLLSPACRVLSARGKLSCGRDSSLTPSACANAGESEMKELKRQDVSFALVVADSLLARDRLERALKLGQEKLREKQVSGLKRDDLVFCDD